MPDGDLVLGAPGGTGARVDCAGFGRLDLEGPQALWLVVSGALDLFAVDAGQQGHGHHLGRLEAGALLLGPVSGPRHTLVARLSRDCVAHRIGLRELYQPADTRTWTWTSDEYGDPGRCRRRRARWSTRSPWASAAVCPSSSGRRRRRRDPPR